MTYNLPPAPKEKHFLLGNLPYLAKEKMRYFLRQRQELGNIYQIYSPIRKVIVVTHPDYVKQVLQDNNKNYTKSFAYDKLKMMLGMGLLTSEGDFWKSQRRLMQPAFYKEKLNRIGELMVELTRQMLDSWEAKANGEQLLNFSFEANKIALDIVSKSLFFSDITDEVEQISKDVTMAIEFGSDLIDNPLLPPIWVPTKRNREAAKVVNRLNQTIFNMIDTRRQNTQKQYNDLLSLLMDAQDEENGRSMSNQQLRDEMITLFVAGHETTATALTWIWYLLGTNPEKCAKMYEEVERVLGNTPPSLENIRNLTYTKQIIDESMRLYPPAWIIGRRAISADSIGGYDIPPKYNVVMPIYVIHHDESIWENAEKFVPERFAPENLKEIHKYAYFPFGGGPRFCIGNNFAIMEMQIILAMIAQRYKLTISPDFKVEMHELITLRSKNPLFVQVKKK